MDGVDTSPGMIAQARRLCPEARFAATHVPLPGASFDLVLLFAVLTCVPDDDAQHLLSAFDAIHSRTLPVPTMNGHPAKAIQLLVRAPAAT
ncbi:class I SAM-dependent methyltransferase [Streptomyces acidiscabies]|uniref:class I SAM-dependent methyltransferase n=1 Tax=Streptomyces acidiscabies TaxID=42234 RepID=UPI002115EE12|nr:class I SAM-dependent methyltransferase [Streptomyces acidiscabies]